MKFPTRKNIEPVSFDSDALNPKRRYMSQVQEVIASMGLETPFLVEEYCVIVTVRKGFCYVIELNSENFRAQVELAVRTLFQSKSNEILRILK
jgi:hypothetical protein